MNEYRTPKSFAEALGDHPWDPRYLRPEDAYTVERMMGLTQEQAQKRLSDRLYAAGYFTRRETNV